MNPEFSLAFTLDRRYSMQVLQPADVDKEYVQYMNNPERVQYLENVEAGTVTVESQRAYVQHVLDHPTDFILGLYDQQRLIGSCGIQGYIGALDRKTYLGMFLGPAEYSGRGLGTAMVWASTKSVLSAGTNQSILAGVDVRNKPSIRVFEKCGYRLVGEKTHATHPYHVFEASLSDLVPDRQIRLFDYVFEGGADAGKTCS